MSAGTRASASVMSSANPNRRSRAASTTRGNPSPDPDSSIEDVRSRLISSKLNTLGKNPTEPPSVSGNPGAACPKTNKRNNNNKNRNLNNGSKSEASSSTHAPADTLSREQAKGKGKEGRHDMVKVTQKWKFCRGTPVDDHDDDDDDDDDDDGGVGNRGDDGDVGNRGDDGSLFESDDNEEEPVATFTELHPSSRYDSEPESPAPSSYIFKEHTFTIPQHRNLDHGQQKQRQKHQLQPNSAQQEPPTHHHHHNQQRPQQQQMQHNGQRQWPNRNPGGEVHTSRHGRTVSLDSGASTLVGTESAKDEVATFKAIAMVDGAMFRKMTICGTRDTGFDTLKAQFERGFKIKVHDITVGVLVPVSPGLFHRANIFQPETAIVEEFIINSEQDWAQFLETALTVQQGGGGEVPLGITVFS
ncbi:hypothetical protein DFH27DRAFT_218399 [Peziza echinospora]|nr:hypothetical protein DFH27DRAFT_218399 [Peziza echinospora]